jgi:alpha- and gamma-adaptin-binding protein p34
MLGVDELPEAIVLDTEIHAYPLHLDTKYYTADIHLCTMKLKTIGCQDFAESVGATVIKFDSDKVSFFTTINHNQ